MGVPAGTTAVATVGMLSVSMRRRFTGEVGKGNVGGECGQGGLTL
jgi:hypothetical protein